MRGIDAWVAGVAEGLGFSVPALILLSVVAAGLVGALWYLYPAWLPRNWGWIRAGRVQARRGRSARSGRQWHWLRWRWRRRRRQRGEPEAQPEPALADDQVPDLPAAVLALTADQLAQAGRYAEAVRERLRAMLRDLMERGLLPDSAGWTVMELAATGARSRPALAAPLRAAADTFSEIWYGLRPATAEDDAAMRGHAAQVAATATQVSAGTPVGRP